MVSLCKGTCLVCHTVGDCFHCKTNKQSLESFFGKIQEDCNFRNFYENSKNSEKYPLPKNTVLQYSISTLYFMLLHKVMHYDDLHVSCIYARLAITSKAYRFPLCNYNMFNADNHNSNSIQSFKPVRRGAINNFLHIQQ